MKDNRAEKFRPPHQLLRLTEPVRAMLELGSLHLAEPWLHSLPGGDGHPVLVIPGFTGGDMSTIVLRNFLDQLGYQAHRWEQGVNFGIRPELYQGAKQVLLRLNEAYGCTVSLVGQSLGGIYARELAKDHPEAVRQVVCLGSPFNDRAGIASNVTRLYRYFNRAHQTKSAQFKAMGWELAKAPPVPTTSVYSKADGVCHWRACIQHGGHDQVENIEVMGSHTGMAVNAQVLFVIADRLTQRKRDWRPFHPGSYLGLRLPAELFAR